MSESSQDPKVIVDEDWKSRVNAEKEALKHSQGDAPEGTATGATGSSGQLPEASFPLLLTTLATQALAALGQVAPADATEVPVDLNLAKHLIDMLEILEQKTTGNLTPDESQMLSQLLYELRMVFVATRKQLDEQNKGGTGQDKGGKGKIITGE